jgi:hypothetical protein
MGTAYAMDTNSPMGRRAEFNTKVAKASCPLCCLAIAFLCIVAGAIMVPLGSAAIADAEKLSPETEFTSLGTTCTLTSVNREAIDRTGSEKNDDKFKCFDIYSYDFQSDFTGAVFYQSKESPIEYQRSYSGKCADTESKKDYDAAGPFKLPSQGGPSKVDCWKPSEGKLAEDVPSQYTCGNPQCYKIYNPKDEAEGALAAAKALKAGGYTSITVGAVIGSLSLVGVAVACSGSKYI